jgi:hypothetical protein
LLLLAVGVVLVGAGLLTDLPLALVPIAWSVSGAGVGFAYSAGSLLCLAAAPAGREGETSGQMQLAEALATALGTGLGGALLTAAAASGEPLRLGYGAVVALNGVAALLGLALAGRMVVRRADSRDVLR